MHRIAAKFVPSVLTQDQKDSRLAICQELKETVINDPTLLFNVIAGNESIVYAYDPETKLLFTSTVLELLDTTLYICILTRTNTEADNTCANIHA